MALQRRRNTGSELLLSFAHPASKTDHLKPMQDLTQSEASMQPYVQASEFDTSLLDNPILNALSTEHEGLAVKNGQVRRYPAAIGPLSGMPDQSEANYLSLRALAGPGGVVGLFLEEKPAPPAGWTLLRGGVLGQMICFEPVRNESSVADGVEVRRLTQDDVPAMMELAKLTEPGPFREKTSDLGLFLGIFEGKMLLAMVGQRMHLPQFVEVSAVCTHPDARGRGYARLLIQRVNAEIRERGKVPILHSFADNWPAIRVYESLGFTMRRTFELAILKNEG
jgi:ribosomal protein S18 acetylase RimI-like enzyme